MGHTLQSPETQAISQAWLAFKEAIGVTSIHSETDYERARAIMNALVDEVRGDEEHLLADLLECVGEQMEAWEDEHVQIPDAEPRDVLRYFMEEHGLQPEDLADCAPPDRISEILEGKRTISKAVAKKLAQRFHLSVDLFL